MRFRTVVDADFSALCEMRRDVYLQAMLMAVPDATDDASVRVWIERRLTEPSGAFRIIADVRTNEVLGFIQISQIHRRNRCGYGGLALLEKARSRGIGHAAMHEIARTAREDLGLTKLMAEIRTDNPASLRLHLANGYRLVGTLSAHFIDADHAAHDVSILECLVGPRNLAK